MNKSVVGFLVFLFSLSLTSGAQDSMQLGARDSAVVTNTLSSDSSSKRIDSSGFNAVNRLLSRNIFLNYNSKPLAFLQVERKQHSKDIVFYGLVAMLLFLGLLRAAWPQYFHNLLRVFFNTSLRQGQLTDQLLQARLPSLFFNIFFVLISGWYVYLLLNYYNNVGYDSWRILLFCIAGFAAIYSVKYVALLFAGWITGYERESETYTFIVFLINKMIAICLLPVVLIMPFANSSLVNIVVIISYLLIAVMFIMRFFRSYGLLQHKIRISGVHFLLYVIGAELLPLVLIYKVALLIMTKNL